MLKITERKNEMYSNLVDTIGFLKGIDPDVADAMDKELARQKRNLELIASENIVSPAVMAEAFLRTSMLRDTPASVITADARTLI